MSELYFLPASYGDAFILHCKKGEKMGWVVVDGGPIKQKNKSPFLQEVDKLPCIELMVLTHHDEDHIKGILEYVNRHKEDNLFPVKRFWVNCARQIGVEEGGELSARQASNLADLLCEIDKENTTGWKESITDGIDTSDISFADIDVLSPNKVVLQKYIEQYEKRIKKETPIEGLNLTAEEETNDLKVSLKELAKRPKDRINDNVYSVQVNMASIAFVLRCDGLSVLMLGDSFPQQIVDALIARKYTKDKKLKVDFVKVAHHGSKFNTCNELLDLIDCQNFLISTDGGKGESYHPNREALANILCHSERDYEKTIHLHFNYSLQSIKDLNGFDPFNEEEKQEYNFEIHEPDEEKTECKYRATRY